MLSLTQVSIRRQGVALFQPISLTVAAGQVLSLMGASGSGKSTLLSYVIGALAADFEAQGDVTLNGRHLNASVPEQRRIGILFQDDLLFPHWNVGQNLAFALPARIKGKSARREYLEQRLVQIGLPGFHERHPNTLSGGQRARVSVLRALLAEPEALLLDEPFGKLDMALRAQFRTFVFEQIRGMNIPAILVTHDPADVPAGGEVYQLC